jgi:mannose-6-phosphate isomerase
MQKTSSIYALEGTIQHYSWGGSQYIPALKGIGTAGLQPCAEYWMGAHDQSPSILPQGRMAELNRFIAADPSGILGKRVAAAFGRLPYLMKVLDVKDMLSIQVHPSKQYAEQAFQEEDKKGIPLTSPRRNYKDDNHKPELMYALSEFYLLHGFKPAQAMQQVIQSVPELTFLLGVWQKGSYHALFKHVMEMPQHEVQHHLKPLVDRIVPILDKGQLSKQDPLFWAARAYKTFCTDGVIDRGLFSIFFLNLLKLSPGQVIFQDAGLLHAYLEGQNIELMANSDNVLRGGLTQKHIDVIELMKNVNFIPVTPRVVKPAKGRSPFEKIYPTPAADFELHVYELPSGANERIGSDTADIYLILNGSVEAKDEISTLSLNKGDAFISIADSSISLQCLEKAQIFRASVPVSSRQKN